MDNEPGAEVWKAHRSIHDAFPIATLRKLNIALENGDSR